MDGFGCNIFILKYLSSFRGAFIVETRPGSMILLCETCLVIVLQLLETSAVSQGLYGNLERKYRKARGAKKHKVKHKHGFIWAVHKGKSQLFIISYTINICLMYLTFSQTYGNFPSVVGV